MALGQDTINWYIRAHDQTKAAIASAQAGLRAYEQQLSGLQGTLQSFGKITFGVIAVDTFANAAKAIVDVQIKYDSFRNTLAQGVGFENVAREMQYVTDVSKTLGLDLNTAGEQYAKLTAASRGTELQGTETRKIFEAVSKASSAMGLSSEQSAGALNALQQMISKGKVQAEELRGQLGERIPGAFQIFARSMGVSTEALNEMLEKGQVGIDTLAGFARQLDKEVSAGAVRAADSMQSAVNRMSTAWTEFQRALVGGPVEAAMKTFIKGITDDLDQFTAAAVEAKREGSSLMSIFDAFMSKWRDQRIQTPAISGTIGGRAFFDDDEAMAAAGANIAKRKKITEDAIAASVKLEARYQSDAQRNKALREEITTTMTTAGRSKEQIDAVIKAAIKPPPKGAKSVFQKITEEIDQMENALRRTMLGERESKLTELAKKGAKPEQFMRAKAILDEADAYKERIAAAERNNEEFDRELALVDALEKRKTDWIEGLRKEGEEQSFLAEMIGKTNAEREVELKLRQAREAGITDPSQLGQIKGRAEKIESDRRLNQLLGGGTKERYAQFDEDTKILQERFENTGDLVEWAEGMNKAEQAVEGTRDSVQDLAKAMREQERYNQQFQMTFTSAFEDAIFEGKNLREVINGLIIDSAKLILRAQILGPLMQTIFSASGGNGGQAPNTKGTIFGALMGLVTGGPAGAVMGAASAYSGSSGGGGGGGGSLPAQGLGNYDPYIDESGGYGIAAKSTGGGNVSIVNHMNVGQGVSESMVHLAAKAATENMRGQIMMEMDRGGAFETY